MKKLLFFIALFLFTHHSAIAVETPARNITVNTSGFSKNLNSSDTDQQTTDTTIDQLNTITASPHQCNAGNFPLGIDTSGNALNCTPAGSANAITALTGDVTATGPGSVAATLATVNSNTGSFTNANITVNAKGLITAAANGSSGGVTSVTNSDGTITSSPTIGAVVVSRPAITGDVAIPGASNTSTLATVNSNVGSFTNANVTVNGKGLVTAASSGTSVPSSANPTGTVGLSTVNGSLTTYMRSDAAPPLSQSIVPTWTGLHSFTASPISATFSNNVGVGSVNPGDMLDVHGTIRTTGFVLPTNASSGYVLTSNSVGVGTWQPSSGGGSGTPGGNTTNVQYNSSGTFAGNNNFVYDGTNVSIGTTASLNLLAVGNAGALQVNSSGIISPIGGDSNAQLNAGALYLDTGSQAIIENHNGNSGSSLAITGGASGTSSLLFNSSTNGVGSTDNIQFNLRNNNVKVMTIQDNSGTGNVGIGSLAPGQKLDVVGTVRTTGFELTTNPSSGYVLTSNGVGVGTWAPASGGGSTSPGGSNMDIQYNSSGNFAGNSGLIYDGENVGIGTSVPLANLHVGQNTGTPLQFRVDNPKRYSLLQIFDNNLVSVDCLGNTDCDTVTGQGQIAQIFTLNSPTSISAGWMYLTIAGSPYTLGATGTWTVSIQTTADGLPTGTLANANLINNNYAVPTSGIHEYQDIPFNSPANLSPGVYAEVFVPNTSQPSGYGWLVSVNPSSSYTGGYEAQYNGSWVLNSPNVLGSGIYGQQIGGITPFPTVVDNNGNVGINTASPINPLQVSFPSTGDYISYGETTFSLQGAETITVPSLSPYWMQGNENIGAQLGGIYLLGTLNGEQYNGPNIALLSYTGNTIGEFTLGDFSDFNGSIDSGNLWYNQNATDNSTPVMEIANYTSGNVLILGGANQGYLNPTIADGISTLQVLGLSTTDQLNVTGNGAPNGISMTVASGNVGIGTSLPDGTFAIGGNCAGHLGALACYATNNGAQGYCATLVGVTCTVCNPC